MFGGAPAKEIQPILLGWCGAKTHEEVFMKNLAGVKEADQIIHEELLLAGIQVVKGERNKGEVPYSLTGRIGNWKFRRAWYYWMVRVDDGCEGLPLEVAAQLHEKAYPVSGENLPKTYGQVVRVAGDCGCPHPKEWAFPSDDVLAKELKRLGKEDVNYGDLAKLCNTGVITVPRFVENYHIDSQLGLNEFARVVRKQEIDRIKQLGKANS